LTYYRFRDRQPIYRLKKSTFYALQLEPRTCAVRADSARSYNRL